MDKLEEIPELDFEKKRRKRKITKGDVFWFSMMGLSIYLQSIPALILVTLLWIIGKLPSGQAESIKGENYCILCGGGLTVHDKRTHPDYCEHCFIEDTAIASTYDLPPDEV